MLEGIPSGRRVFVDSIDFHPRETREMALTPWHKSATPREDLRKANQWTLPNSL